MSTKTQIINALSQNFNLSPNQTDILLLLCQKDQTASDILKNSTISNGRIYRLLSELTNLGLIDKIISPDNKTSLYSLKNFSGNIQAFLEHSLSVSSQKHFQITTLLSQLDHHLEAQVIYGSKKEFDLHIINLLNTGKTVKILHKHQSLPWFLYAFDDNTFKTVRHIISQTRIFGTSPSPLDQQIKRNAYIKAYQKINFYHIFSKETFKRFKPHLDIKSIQSNLKKYPHVKLFIIDKLNNPFSTYIGDNTVLQPLFFENKTNRILKLQGQDLISTYNDYFDKYLEDSVSLISFIH